MKILGSLITGSIYFFCANLCAYLAPYNFFGESLNSKNLKIGLVTLNARFVHVALSLRYLRNAAVAADFNDVWIEEYTIDQPVWKIAADIQQRKPDVVGLSIYIWNHLESFHLMQLVIISKCIKNFVH